MTPSDPDSDSVSVRLLREPYRFDFAQAVRLLEWLTPNRPPTGTAGRPMDEVVQFTVHQTLAFPASQIDALTHPPGEGPPRMAVNFFGLTGPAGVLPQHYTQLLQAQQRAADNPERRSAADWFDLFNHRMIAIFHRAWAKYRMPITFERAARAGRRDPVTNALLSLLGIGTPGLQDRVRVDAKDDASDTMVADRSLARYAGLFAHAVRSAAGLGRMLADYFRIPVAVEQFRGHWVRLEEENQTRLSRNGQNVILGESVIVGRSYWDAQGRFRLRLGPMRYSEFIQWLPNRETGRRKILLLAELTRFYIRDGFDFEIQLVLAAAEVPPLQLHREMPRPRLGWNTWLGHRSDKRDADDPVFCSTTLARRYVRPDVSSGGP